LDVRYEPFITRKNKPLTKLGSEPCKSLEPEWMTAALGTDKTLISVDCATEHILCAEYSIVSYPAFRLFKGGDKVMRYRGPRKASA
jgi:protein disulfide-isomerase A1